MKNFILIISLLLSGIAFGQNTNSPSPPPTTSKYPIYNNSNTSVDVLAIYENPDQMPDFPDGVLALELNFKMQLFWILFGLKMEKIISKDSLVS